MRNQYKTQQKKILLEFLEENCDKQLSIDEILSMLPENTMGKSTVYRLVHKLTEDGVLKRHLRENSQTFVYQLFDENRCRNHLHLKCISCGQFIHLENKVSNDVLNSINNACQFDVDATQTVFVGKCRICCGK